MMQTPQVAQPPVPPAAPAQIGGADVMALRNQLVDLQAQLAGVTAEWNGVDRQLQRMNKMNYARPEMQQRAADLGIQRATLEGQVASLKARLGDKTGFTTEPPTSNVPRGIDPNMVVGLSFVLAIGVLVPYSIARARRIWNGTGQPVAPRTNDQSAMRLERLEQAVDTVAIEIERISESQRFMTKLMADRAEAARSASAGDSRPAVGADGKPVLALGAGPVEPIRVGERQAVKQAITPH